MLSARVAELEGSNSNLTARLDEAEVRHLSTEAALQAIKADAPSLCASASRSKRDVTCLKGELREARADLEGARRRMKGFAPSRGGQHCYVRRWRGRQTSSRPPSRGGRLSRPS